MFTVALYEPEIPQNTGNIIRLCANTGLSLDLIGPLGFSLSEKRLRRAGLDYHQSVKMIQYADFDHFLKKLASRRLFAFSTKSTARYDKVAYRPGDVFLFGPESRGLPIHLFDQCEAVLRLPMVPESRSLNLANAVSVVAFEALRQHDFIGLA